MKRAYKTRTPKSIIKIKKEYDGDLTDDYEVAVKMWVKKK